MKSWTSKLRPAFLARTRREKAFAVLLLVAVAAIWLSSVMDRARDEVVRWRAVQAGAASQTPWLNGRADIEARYEEILSRLSGETPPTKNEVLARIQELVRKNGFAQFTLNPPTSQSSDRLTFHSYSLSIQKANFDQLRAFYQDLTTGLPTTILEEITVAADRRDSKQLDARLRLVAVELNR